MHGRAHCHTKHKPVCLVCVPPESVGKVNKEKPATVGQEYLALPLAPLLSLHISPAPVGVGGGAESPHMTGHAASKGRDNAALDAVAAL